MNQKTLARTMFGTAQVSNNGRRRLNMEVGLTANGSKTKVTAVRCIGTNRKSWWQFRINGKVVKGQMVTIDSCRQAPGTAYVAVRLPGLAIAA